MISTNSSSPAGVFSFSSGSSLIDFTALTTLIGSAAAESLILGNQGAAGVAWATMSAFGLAWVIRACISAASPGWLRETMGIRTHISDLAVGMELSSSSFARAAAKTKRINGASGPLGFVIESSEALRRVRFYPLSHGTSLMVVTRNSLTRNTEKDGQIESNPGRRFMHSIFRCHSC